MAVGFEEGKSQIAPGQPDISFDIDEAVARIREGSSVLAAEIEAGGFTTQAVLNAYRKAGQERDGHRLGTKLELKFIDGQWVML